MRLHTAAGANQPGARHIGVHPNLLLSPVHDDTGATYHGMPGGGGGSERDWRQEMRFAPAIAEGATRLQVRVEEIQWVSMMPGVRSRTEIGPWTFEIPLADLKPATG